MYFAIIISIIIIITVLIILNTQPINLSEGFDPAIQQSNEALLNLASAYNSGNAVLTNLRLTGNLNVDGNIDNNVNKISTRRFCTRASNDWTYCWLGGEGGANGSLNSLDLHVYQNDQWRNNPITFSPTGGVNINSTNLNVNGRNILAEIDDLKRKVNPVISNEGNVNARSLRVGGWTFNDAGWNREANQGGLQIRYDQQNVGLGDSMTLISGWGYTDICGRRCYGRF